MSEEICTEVVCLPWPNALTEWVDKQPLILLRGWMFYCDERVRRMGQDMTRVVIIARHVCTFFGATTEIRDLRMADFCRYADHRMAQGKTASTVRKELAITRAMLGHNYRRERLDKIPPMEKPSGDGRKRRPLTEDEYRAALRKPLSRRARLFLIVAYWTGHRSRAIETLPWSRVNFDIRTIDFNDPELRKTNKRRVDGFPMSDELFGRLRAAKEYADQSRPDDPYVIGLGESGRPTSTYHEIKRVLRSIGVNELGVCRHSIRKLFVTERIKVNCNPEKVAALIGDNPQTMRKHYLQLLTDDLRSTVERRAA